MPQSLRSLPTLVAALMVVGACADAPVRPGTYQRGTTDYEAGKAQVRQPGIAQTPGRSFAGFRVAGPDTDLDTEYWDDLWARAGGTNTGPEMPQRNPMGMIRIFDTFRARHKDLEIYQSDAAAAALREFRRWTVNRYLGKAFDDYWSR